MMGRIGPMSETRGRSFFQEWINDNTPEESASRIEYVGRINDYFRKKSFDDMINRIGTMDESQATRIYQRWINTHFPEEGTVRTEHLDRMKDYFNSTYW